MSEKIELKEFHIYKKFMADGYTAEMTFTVSDSEIKFQLGPDDMKGIVEAAGEAISKAAVKATNIMNDSVLCSLALSPLKEEEGLKEDKPVEV